MKPSQCSAARERKHRTWRRGLLAEWRAMLYFAVRGWRVVAHRLRNHHGEIDLILARGKTLAFIEVKARPTLEDGLHAVRPHQRTRIVRAANMWLATHPAYAHYAMRFDLVVVLKLWHIRHVPYAFDAGEN